MSVRRKTVMVVDAVEDGRDRLATPLKREYRVLRAATGEAALTAMERDEVDLVLADVRLPGITGFELLQILRANYPLTESILVTSTADLEGAVQAIKLGAYHFLSKDVDPDDLRTTVAHALERQDLNRRVLTLREEVQDLGDREFITGASQTMRDLLDVVRKVGKLSATVLVLGESGTGKELLARMIHREAFGEPGGQSEPPFIAVNLAAIPRELVESTLFGHERGSFTGAHKQQLGKFELAAGGTLFLDEIGDLRFDLQAKLLRAIQEGEIERVGGIKPIKTDFRLVVATNVDLDKAVKDGRFREDLYYRINVIPIRMPPLRERIDDLPELARLFLERYRGKFRKPVRGISDSALKILQSYWWPGNIRELENLIERLVAVSDKEWITDEDLPLEYHFARLDSAPSSGEALFQEACDTFERNFILRALEKSDWNVTATARYLGIPLSTLKHKMARLDLRDLARKLRGA
jgi:two-component system response regulator AtoC